MFHLLENVLGPWGSVLPKPGHRPQAYGPPNMATARQSCTTVKMPCIRCVGALVSSACNNSGEQKIEREAGNRSARDEEWACQLEGSKTFEGAGVGYPEPAERAGNDQQARLPLVGARGME